MQSEIDGFMNSLFEDENKTEYLWLTLASSLFEGNRQQELYILTGEGSNGKSLLMTLIDKAFGAYNGDMSYASLTSRRKTENAFSDWVKTRPMRFVKCLEPDAKSMIQGNIVKKITGGDTMTERELHKNTVSWRPLFVFYLIANEVPRFDHIDQAVERRLRFIHFPFQFKYKEQLGAEWDEGIHRERDDDLASKFETDSRYGEQFMLMLIDKYVAHLKGKDHSAVLSKIPKDFSDKQREFQLRNNIVATFVKERYDILPWATNKDLSLTIEHIYDTYRIWAQGQLMRTTDKNMTYQQF
jgi:phage/plasmid-associated DNA primase